MLALLGACDHGSSRGRTPEPVPPATYGVTPSEAALASFTAVARRYAAAKARGPLSANDCRQLPQAFVDVYREHGTALAIAKFDAAATLQECGDIDRAVELYEELAREVPRFALTHNNLGVIYFSRKQESLALAAFTRAVEADTTITAPRNNLAAALREKYASKPVPDDFARAELEAQSVLALDSNNRLAFENLARIYYDRGRLQDRSYLMLAQLVITQGLAKVDKGSLAPSAELHNLQGLVMMQREDPVAALHAFKRAVELDAEHAGAHLNIALVAIRFRDYRTAEQSLELALVDRRQRRNVDAYLGLGVAQRGLRKYDAAHKSFEKALEVGADPRGLYNLGVLYQDHVGPANDRETKKGFDKRPYERARGYFAKFVAKAGGQRSLERHAAEATRRIDSIDTFLRNVDEMAELERERERMAELERKQQEEEKQRLLEVERKLRGDANPQP
jgi:tetratricopeptide (TPR) repeat protein